MKISQDLDKLEEMQRRITALVAELEANPYPARERALEIGETLLASLKELQVARQDLRGRIEDLAQTHESLGNGHRGEGAGERGLLTRLATDHLGTIRGRARAKETAEALRHNERRLRAIFDNASLGLAEVNAEGRITTVNPRACHILGYTPEELTRLTIHELTFPDDRALSDDLNARLARGELDRLDYEKRYRRRDGSPVWVHVTVSPIRGPGGEFAGAVGTVEDITERRWAREALRESEERLRQACEVAQLGIFRHDHEADNVYWSPQMRRLHDWDPEASVTLAEFLARVDSADRDRVARAVRAAHDPTGDGFFGVKYRFPWRDGTLHYMSVQSQTFFAGEGLARRPVRTIGAVLDITEPELAEEALRQSEERFRNLVETTSDWVWEVNEDTVYTYVSPKVLDILGYEPHEVVGKTPFDLMPPEEVRRVREIYDPIHRAHRSFDALANTNRHKDGHLVVLETSGVPVFDRTGQFRGYRGIDRDITERRRTEEALKQLSQELERRVAERTAELQEAVEELKRSNDDLEKFAYISSHDLQEPLRMIGSYVGLLAMNYKDKLDDDARDFISYAEEGAVRMSTLIKDLLAYSRVNTQGQNPMPTDMRAVVQRVLDALRLKIEETGARVTVGDLPTVVVDATQLEQVFQNLIENAIKYRKDTEPPVIQITAERKEKEGRWLFSVKDNGIGIEPRFHEHIFVAFKRLHADRSKYPGTGIGLAIVKRIVERHHGRVCVESKPGEGSTFYFTLPAG